VLKDDEGKTAVRGHDLQELHERVKPARRKAPIPTTQGTIRFA